MKISHVAWNLTGLGIPLLIAAIAIPSLLKNIGNERFGLLALAWGLIGYAGIFDLGIGRSLTKIIATRLGALKNEDIPDALFTAIRLTYKISLYGTTILCLAAVFGATNFLKIETITQSELIFSAVIFSLALPLQAISATYKGVNEAYLNFKAISIIRIFLGASTFGLPMLVSIYSTSMPALIGTLVASRLLAFLFYRHHGIKCIAHIRGINPKYQKPIRNEILKFGGWFSVSNIINPVVSSLDRIFIGTLISSAAITAYAIPQEIATQSLIIVGAITTVTFPYLSSLIASDARKANAFFLKLTIGVTVFMTALSLGLIALGPTMLDMWLNSQLSENSSKVIQILAIGLIPYTVGTMLISKIHAHGRTDLTAKLHIFEALPFLTITYQLIAAHGIVGAAVAWTVRSTIDACSLTVLGLYLSRKGVKE
jgi:O-antigen/teichoic acid export membrane protein